ncbi:lysozyme inhibitor LprI family protein [Neisseria animalis]|uniref:DUF1311 domain-containing protein n=1 Tax=Neisseria animalis TaxID=492 RepID=A0A5P3MQH0_NEIAN|nr:lysozyme inhibitor LprI family protein [Neisseria animalis]QEY23826.1 DUF1311 domain-containing protein [Neisseria animalis]ROW31605.1 DUF1311 domain-containing protein [Neisseria animalis]VEE09804.1 Lipoprotein [Neisseria animalis]
MHPKLLAAALLPLLLLGACRGEKPEQNQPALACDHPNAVQNVRDHIIGTLTREAKAFARNDNRKFVDADKIIAAATQLTVRLDQAKAVRDGNKMLCQAGLSVHIPSDIAAAAESGSPLIYGQTAIRELVEQKIMGSNLDFDGSTFRTVLRYTPKSDGGIAFQDNAIEQTAQTLSVALLPYGVKSIVVIDGQAVSKEEAVKRLSAEQFPEPPAADPEDILENNAASQAEGVPAATEFDEETEVLVPNSGDTPDIPAVAQSELDNARTQNQHAEADITRIWHKMERGVQQNMIDEQRAWLHKKQQDCLRASAVADNPAQAEYLQLQCDTRMTRERMQYLRGYVIE